MKAVAAILLALAIFAGEAAHAAPTTGKNQVMVREKAIDVYFLPAAGTPLHQSAIYLPGDGGWRGHGITIAEKIAGLGYDVYGVDTKQYLESFGTVTPADVAADLRAIAQWTNAGKQPITLVGWSEGAGLTLLAAADPQNKRTFAGLVVIGMPDSNILGWHTSDFTSWITKKPPNEPKFSAAEYVGKVTPLPLFQLNSTNDEYVTGNTATRLFAAASTPKKMVWVEASDHKFGGALDRFVQELRNGLQWISENRPNNPPS